ADAKDFVLCPGGEYDRSPCGTGTSAKLACLFEDGKLAEGQMVRVESIIGSVFEGSVRKEGERLIPTIIGRAYVNGESTLLIDANDPFAWGTPA
ncbi:MAG TPA: proline racemase family protein, partial [Fimbriimonadaceae bacterium]|nr:proline racemase family protein [Fimbriimonadaceae bacterium]